jgi:GH15 family glucan-1,4-alpha-glucosidase
MSKEYKPIENYGVIGNLQTIALVGIDASIDFLCFPYFDSPSIFASLLDAQRGGCFSLSPVLQSRRPKQIYLLNSNILLTRFLSPDGVAEVSDYADLAGIRRRAIRSGAPARSSRKMRAWRGQISNDL